MDFSLFELILISIMNIKHNYYSTRSGHNAIDDITNPIRSELGEINRNHELVTTYLSTIDDHSSNNAISDRRTAFVASSLALTAIGTYISTQTSNLNSSRCLSSDRDCSFYSRCLENAIPCGENGYATGFGTKYCTKFSQNSSKFSPKGQTWMWNTMSCLQKVLEPIANKDTNISMNCSQIKEFAYNSHPNCYVISTPGGVCLLPVTDWVELVKIVEIDMPALKQAVSVAKSCGKVYYGKILATTKTLYASLHDKLHSIV